MSKQILIELVGENETGYCYADLYLPASAEEIAEAKERANWNSDSNGIRDISIEHCSTLPKLASFRLDSPTLDELNFLAQRLDAMDGGERTIMNGVLQYLCSEKGFADELVSMTDLINMTYGLDGVMIASNVGTDRQLGQFVIDNELNEDVNAIAFLLRSASGQTLLCILNAPIHTGKGYEEIQVRKRNSRIRLECLCPGR